MTVMRRFVVGVVTFAIASVGLTVPAEASLAVGGGCSGSARLLGFSDDLDKTTYDGLPVSGLSAIARTGHDRSLVLVDNIGTTPARVFHLGPNGVDGMTILRRPDGTPYNGTDFDGEGLVVDPGARTILASSETEPSIRRFRLSDGREIGSLPVPSRYRVAPAGEAARNQTFEALASDGHTLYAGMEGPLSVDGRDAAGRGLQRIVRYDGERVSGQYAYRPDPALGLVELAVAGPGTLIAMERGFVAGVGNTVRVFAVSTRHAPDVSGIASLAQAPEGVYLRKELLFDLADCPPMGATAKQPQPNPLLDNVEGLALGKRRLFGWRELTLISDDNGNATQITRVYRLSVRV